MPDAKGMPDANINQEPQPTLNTKNLWLNIIITHSKVTSSPFTSLLTIFQYFLNLRLLPSYIVTNSAIKMNMCRALPVNQVA